MQPFTFPPLASLPRRIATFALLLAPGLSSCTAEPSAAHDAASLAVVGATVITMDAPGRVADATVLISGDSILSVGPRDSVVVPPGTTTIDGRGRFLVPGFTDAHIHLRSEGELLSYLRHGVTTVWNLSGTPEGVPDVLEARRAIDAGERPGPTIYTTGPVLDGDPPNFAAVSTVVTDVGQAETVVEAQKRRGYDFLKIYNNLDPAVAEAAISAAHARGMPVFGHVPRRPERATALQHALQAGLDVITHAEEIFFTYHYEGVEEMLDAGDVPYRDAAGIPEVVALIRDADAAVIPNLSFVAGTRRQLDDLEALQEDPGAILEDPESRYLAPETRQMWTRYNVTRRSDLERYDRREVAKFAYVRQLTLALANAGVPLFAGTDATLPGLYPGPSLHLELKELVVAGLSPHQALATATRAPGEFLRRHVAGAPRSSVIAPGARADLVLLSADPLENIAHTRRVEGVVVRGRWFTVDELETLRHDANLKFSRNGSSNR